VHECHPRNTGPRDTLSLTIAPGTYRSCTCVLARTPTTYSNKYYSRDVIVEMTRELFWLLHRISSDHTGGRYSIYVGVHTWYEYHFPPEGLPSLSTLHIFGREVSKQADRCRLVSVLFGNVPTVRVPGTVGNSPLLFSNLFRDNVTTNCLTILKIFFAHSVNIEYCTHTGTKGDYFPGVPGSYVLRNELLVPYDRERVAANTLSNPARFLYYIYLPQQSFIICFCWLIKTENNNG
jgi:hypothetical protein